MLRERAWQPNKRRKGDIKLGDPRRLKKTWEGPKKPWRATDLREALKLIGEYGLRNKRELYKAQTIARRYRKMARKILGLPEAERAKVEKELVQRLYRLGLIKYENATADSILSLTAKDVLERRLQTIVFRKGYAPTIHAARQMVVHRHITIDDRVVDVPGYFVKADEESRIKIRVTSPFYKVYQQKLQTPSNTQG